MKKVNVILSTYNGESFLKPLLESIRQQTYKNMDVYIRDDGSSDATNEIIQEYCALCDEGIHFYLIEDDMGNLGSGSSFAYATAVSPKADYYAFADQDDIWKPEKIERAVDILDRQKEDVPFLYASNYEFCDDKLNVLSMGRLVEKYEDMNVGRAFMTYGASLGQGFTMVFNHALKEMAFQKENLKVFYQDAWLVAVIVGIEGGYYYDEYPTALYRRHIGTVTPTGNGTKAMWEWRLKEFLGGTYFKQISEGIDTYSRLYSKHMKKEEDITFVKIFGGENGFGKNRLKKVFYPYKLKKTLMEEVTLRFAFLCGKV